MTAKEFSEKIVPLGDALYRVAFHLLESSSDAEDAVQDLYVKLWNSRDRLDDIANPKAWCLTLMRNLCLDRIRSASRKTQTVDVENDSMLSIAGDNGPEVRMEQRERMLRVMKAISTLPERQRKVLGMKVIEGLSYEEIEDRTGINNLMLRVLVSSARKKLRQIT